MTEAEKDNERAKAAVMAIIDGRDMAANSGAILVTLDHAVALALIAILKYPALCAIMLNEGLVPGIEDRLAFYASKLKDRIA